CSPCRVRPRCTLSLCPVAFCFFFFSSRRRHTRSKRDWSSDVCSSDLAAHTVKGAIKAGKAISGAAKGAAAGGPYGAVAGAVWAGRKHIGKIIAVSQPPGGHDAQAPDLLFRFGDRKSVV